MIIFKNEPPYRAFTQVQANTLMFCPSYFVPQYTTCILRFWVLLDQNVSCNTYEGKYKK
jgi:hypothetical protein